MLDSLYEETLKKRDLIQDKIKNYFEDKEFDKSLWINTPIKENKWGISLAGGDGSLNNKKYLSFIFYAIDAETLIYNQKGLKKIGSSEVDIMPPHRHFRDRLRNYMGIFELKNALNALKNFDVDLYLFDGSPLGNLIRPFPLEYELSSSLKRDIRKLYLGKLEKELEKELIEISSTKITQDIDGDEHGVETLIYLENIENLLIMRKLLDHGRKLVGISKTSTSNDYFKEKIPDIAIFSWIDKGTGYSPPKCLKLSTELKREFPILNEYFHEIEFTIFYARFEPFKNILKIELPYRATEEEVIKVLEIIKGNCTLGYPYLLKKAHNDVVIRNKDLERLSNIIGFLEKSGREML